MSCPFYGKNGMFGRLLDSGGNQCALIVTSYAPCVMQMDGEEPDGKTCTVVARARQIHGLVECAKHADRPDFLESA